MTQHGRGRRAALLLCLTGFAAPTGTPTHADTLTMHRADTGDLLASVPVAPGEGWCILWNHSVQGFEVEDCYENRHGVMVLVRSHLPDFAAGLDHIPGRGRQVSDGMGGYWIEDLDEAVPGNAYILRPGSPAVNHRLRTDDTEISLTQLAERARVRIALQPDMTP